jgi:hypothetical protein
LIWGYPSKKRLRIAVLNDLHKVIPEERGDRPDLEAS